MRILITGSRDASVSWEHLHSDWVWLFRQCLDRGEMITLVHGHCPTGVDAEVNNFEQETSGRYWYSNGPAVTFPMFPLTVERHPAGAPFWEFGPWPAAGPRRNQHMVSLGADLCLAYPFGVSKGTRGCAKMAAEADIPTLLTEYGNNVPLSERLAKYLPGLKLWEK